ncbi:HNH endonuclease signature motif containing protein [Microbacterium radiodurans]|uniref:DUF222 domain-containing protein n=1 Tax=Microbacterium radiodurans TaxID=661398 RepID=A0A5J5IN49_9MICO|nr:HNH endonuclease signature motif containing protein [Microbacterium radiodurans]KAA9084134.1 DUF222 domain-containing protein [Microbacterium radiodurans]
MQTRSGFGSDGDVARLAELVSRAREIEAGRRALEVSHLRLLADAGQLAADQVAGAPEAVKEREMALRGISAELAGVTHMADRTVQRRIDEAGDLVENYAAAVEAWADGRIARRHVDLIRQYGMPLPADARAEFERVAIEKCETDTPNRVEDTLRMISERMHPRSFEERHKEAATTRCIRIDPGRDGMSDLIAHLPTVLAEAISDQVRRQAKAVIAARPKAAPAGAGAVAGAGEDPAAGSGAAFGLVEPGAAADAGADESSFVDDTRSLDEVAADVFTDLLLAGTPSVDPTGDGLSTIRAEVQVVVSALTLMGKDADPADLVGRSPIDAETARLLAGNTSTWSRLLTDPVTGTVLEVDAYTPTAAQRRLLKARDRRCRFPGCRMPAIRCEIDHTVAASDGGPTHICNLADLCKRHHGAKHHTRWSVVQLAGGRLVWTSPTGITYREDAPPPLVAFSIPLDADPPPF